MKTILLLDADDTLKGLFLLGGYAVVFTDSVFQGLHTVKTVKIDLVVIGATRVLSGEAVTHLIKHYRPNLRVLRLSDCPSEAGEADITLMRPIEAGVLLDVAAGLTLPQTILRFSQNRYLTK